MVKDNDYHDDEEEEDDEGDDDGDDDVTFFHGQCARLIVECEHTAQFNA